MKQKPRRMKNPELICILDGSQLTKIRKERCTSLLRQSSRYLLRYLEDLSKMSNNRYEKGGSDWVEKEVAIYGTSDDLEDRYTLQSTRRGPKTRSRSADQKESKTLLCLKVLCVLCVLMAAGILILSICYCLVFLENIDMNDTLNQLQTELSVMTANYSRLQIQTIQLKDQNEVMRINISRLQDNVKKMKNRFEVLKRSKCPDGWTRFGCSCYYKSTEKASWTDSRRSCLQERSDLAVISSKEEQDFLAKLNQNGESWIGMYHGWSSQHERYARIWVDRSVSTEIYWESAKTTYPYRNHIAVYLNAEGRMADLDKTISKNFICEM
ncbi:hypothetical protein OJAV_G00113680 [Oryzias javanicus]|uniref:C-type lectin domain-containing protein n=1 Tax=Oryzias javanicus TaxID=123683 RepID=A0A437CWP3_ORYJA|nr:hypothetical protein OJAV_G00113680 [Oryzias javanicus]